MQVAQAVQNHSADEGILFCWSGTGVSIAANKFAGIRAALCEDAETAQGARLWNNANVLCLSLRRLRRLRRLTSARTQEILTRWFATHYQPNPSDDASLAALAQLDTPSQPKPHE